MKIFLHVGMPKCGSSALQTYLSHNPSIVCGDDKFDYAVIRPGGSLISGNTLIEEAASSAFRYAATIPAERINKMSRKSQNKFMNEVGLLSEHADGLIISSEGWGQKAELFNDECIFNNAEFDTHVIMYVRPQVSWVNSAWWQWGAWTDRPLARWLRANKDSANWFLSASKWREKRWVNDLTIRVLPSSIVDDFATILGAEFQDELIHNKSLPGSMLRIFQRNRGLRHNAHDSSIDFILARHLELDQVATPWVIPPNLVEKLIDYFRDDNDRLMALLSPEQSEIMSNDDRWWSPNAYDSLVHEKAGPIKANAVELESITVAALMAVKSCDKQISVLNKQLRDIKNERCQ